MNYNSLVYYVHYIREGVTSATLNSLPYCRYKTLSYVCVVKKHNKCNKLYNPIYEHSTFTVSILMGWRTSCLATDH